MSEKVDRLLSHFALLSEDERQEFLERWESADVFDRAVIPGSFENIKARFSVLFDELATTYQDAGQLSEAEQEKLEEVVIEGSRKALALMGEVIPYDPATIYQLRLFFCVWISCRVRFDR